MTDAVTTRPAVRVDSAPSRRLFGDSVRGWLSQVADFAIPPVCLECETRIDRHHALCAECWAKISFISAPMCDRLGIPLPYGPGEVLVSAAAAANPPVFDRARAVGLYQGTLKNLIQDFKYRDRQDLLPLLTRWLLQSGQCVLQDGDVLVPVPLYRSRLLKRRFNQSAVLARALSQKTGLLYAPLALWRTRATKQQAGLTRQQRQDNVRGAFQVSKRARRKIAGKRVILVDDVITTGATVSACTRALRQAGADRVDVLAAAIAIPGAGLDAAGGLTVANIDEGRIAES